MKRKKIIKKLLPAWLSKDTGSGKDIHARLEETIAERKKVLQQWERVFVAGSTYKDIHEQLAETITRYKKEKDQWGDRLFTPGQAGTVLMNKRKAA